MNQLIGLASIKKEMKKLMKSAQVYQRGGSKVPNYLIALNAGDGRTFVLEYITDIFTTNKLRNFGGLDEFLEYKLKGTLSQVKQVISDIKINAVYTNDFEGVIAIDISELAEYINEYQTEYFMESIKEIAEHATIIFYYDRNLGKRGSMLADLIATSLDSVVRIDNCHYSSEELAQIVIHNIKSKGIAIKQEEVLEGTITEIIKAKNIQNVKVANKLAEQMAFYVNYDEVVPLLDTMVYINHLRESQNVIKQGGYSHEK